MNIDHSTAPPRRGQSPSAPNNLKYAFDPDKCIVFDAEVYPGRWCCGFLAPDGKHWCVDGDRELLAETLNKIAAAGLVIVGYNSASYDIPVLRAILAGADPYPVSRAIVNYEGWGLPPELRDRAARWPRIEADHVDLVARTRDGRHFPSLKVVAANLGVKHLAELPYSPESPLSDAEWEHVKAYNRKDLEATKAVLDHFAAELAALAALSNRYDLDLRSVHRAGIASKVLCAAYRDRHGVDPVRSAPPGSVRYRPPGPVNRPRNDVAAAWFDRLCSEEFPLGEDGKPIIPKQDAPITIGGITLNVGSGGLHSADRPALVRADAEHELYEADVASYYPSMMAGFGIFPRSLGSTGLEQFKEILAERLEIKERVAGATGKEEAKYLKAQADGLKIVLNSTFGQFGSPYSVLCDPEAFLAVTLTGQLLLIDLVERLDLAGATILSVNTDSIAFKVQRDEGLWHKVLDSWEWRCCTKGSEGQWTLVYWGE
jgi:hypothetical protein